MTCVFLSHASADRAAVRRLADDLTAAGITVWLDERQVTVGDPITQRIGDGIASADYVAVWLTRRAAASQWVRREWGATLNKEITDRNIQVLPLLAETCEIPWLLADKKFADFRGNYDDGLDELLARLGAHRNWTQESLETYLVEHFSPGQFERGGVWRDDTALIVGSASMDGFRGVFWNTETSKLGVWERGNGAQWYGPEPLTENDIQEVVQKLRTTLHASEMDGRG